MTRLMLIYLNNNLNYEEHMLWIYKKQKQKKERVLRNDNIHDNLHNLLDENWTWKKTLHFLSYLNT